PLEIPRIKYSAFKLPPTKEAEGYLRCTSCKKSAAYEKIANIIFASKLGDFDSLFKKTTKNLEAEKEEKIKHKRKVRRQSDKTTIKRSRKAKVLIALEAKNAPVITANQPLRNFPIFSGEDNEDEKPYSTSVDASAAINFNGSKVLQEDRLTLKRKVDDTDKQENENPCEPLKKKHRRSSSFGTKWACDRCDSFFSCAFDLSYHNDNVHSREKEHAIKPYHCPFDDCSKRYKNRNGLKYHLNAQHRVIQTVHNKI
ncbi:Zinc finger C2H2 protein, partial [Nosema granulosis]